MANFDINTPRFYCDSINYLLSRGLALSGNFDVMSGSNLFTTINSGSVAELVDMKPLNKVVIDSAGKSILAKKKTIPPQKTDSIRSKSIPEKIDFVGIQIDSIRFKIDSELCIGYNPYKT